MNATAQQHRTKAAIQQGCLDKVQYASKGKARATAQYFQREDGVPREEYQCAACEKWHVRRVKG